MKNKTLFVISLLLIVFWIVWGIHTLQYTPVPWVDEVYFASVTQSLMDGDGLTLPIGLNEPVYHYGPLYFLLAGLFVLIGGFNLISIRIIGFLFSLTVAYMTYWLLNAKGVNKRIAIIVSVIMLYDQLFVYASHMGRMETVAISFFLIAIFLYEKGREKYSIGYIVTISICMSLSFLTTPRVAVILIPIGLSFMIMLIKSKNWQGVSVFVLIPVVLFISWLFLSYGSVSSFFNYYTSVDNGYEEGNLINRFVGGSFVISKTHYPLVLTSILVLVHSIKNKYYQEISIYLYSIILFYLIVHSTSDTYSIMILPFYYVIIGVGISKLISGNKHEQIWKLAVFGVFAISVIVNVAVFSAKWLLIESSLEYRDKALVDNWIGNSIPEGAVILGSDNYYYSCLEHGCEFKSLTQVYKNEDQFRTFLNDDYNPEFVIYSSKEASPDAIKAFELLNLEFIAHYAPEPQINWLDDLVSKMGLVNNNTFEGDLYKVVY